MKNNFKRSYNFRGIGMYQRELTYREYVDLRKFLGDITLFSMCQKQIGEVITILYDAKKLTEFVQIILHPKLGWMNSLLAKFKRIDLDELVEYLTPAEIELVLADFFFVNRRWSVNLLTLPNDLNLRLQQVERVNPSNMRSKYSNSRKKTSPKSSKSKV